MKIGIVTLYGTFNYGNRLQNYALHTVLSKMGHDVATLVSLESASPLKRVYKQCFERENGSIRLKSFKEIRRDKRFENFTRGHIPTHFFESDKGGLTNDLNNEYDCFVVGSDQVWNPLWWGVDIDCTSANDYLLRFAEPSKRIAYSASFGLESIPRVWEILFKKELTRFASISVREYAGLKIIEDLLGYSVPVTLDPTMLLAAEEWRGIERDMDVTEKYVLQFNLGKKSERQRALINSLKDRGYRIIDYMNPLCKYFGGDPFDFIALLDRAECIITDSFHATVFSLLFEKPFTVFDRIHNNKSNMNSRIDTLLSAFELQNRWNIMDPDTLFDKYICDNGTLNTLRNKSLEYLTQSLKAVH